MSAPVTIGNNLANSNNNPPSLCSSCTVFQASQPGATLVSPFDGTVTAWSYRSTEMGAQYELRVLHPVGGAQYTVTATSASTTVPDGNDTVKGPFTTNLPIKAGDSVGLRIVAGTGVPLFTSSNAGDVIDFFNPPDPADNTTATASSGGGSNQQLLVQAQVQDTVPPDTIIDTGPTGTVPTGTPTFTFHSTEQNSTFECRYDTQPFRPCSGSGGSDTPPSPLTDGPHTFEVRATDPAGNTDPTPASASFTVAIPMGPLPPPAEGQTVNAIPDSGTVLVKVPLAGAASARDSWTRAAAAGFVPLESLGRQIPVGSTLDTSKGKVHLFSATDANGTTQDGHFNGGLFSISQGQKNPLTTLSMTGGGLDSCSKLPPGGSRKTATTSRRVRRLFGDVHGRFQMRGRNSAATVRGTQWTMTDSCAGTLTVVRRGTVVVRDLVKHRTVTLKKGQRYLARRGNR
jgi:hypothetical protein